MSDVRNFKNGIQGRQNLADASVHVRQQWQPAIAHSQSTIQQSQSVVVDLDRGQVDKWKERKAELSQRTSMEHEATRVVKQEGVNTYEETNGDSVKLEDNTSIGILPKYPNGTRFTKIFGGIPCKGHVTSFNGEYYHVLYPEDGDEEDLSEVELDDLVKESAGMEPVRKKSRTKQEALSDNAASSDETPESSLATDADLYPKTLRLLKDMGIPTSVHGKGMSVLNQKSIQKLPESFEEISQTFFLMETIMKDCLQVRTVPDTRYARSLKQKEGELGATQCGGFERHGVAHFGNVKRMLSSRSFLKVTKELNLLIIVSNGRIATTLHSYIQLSVA